MTEKERASHYEKILKQILQPLDEIPFELFVNAISGKRIIPIDAKSEKDAELIDAFKIIMKRTIQAINHEGINAKRPNEAGNKAELFVKAELEKSPLKLQSFSQSAGYPDILIFDKYNRPTYLEVKTYNFANKESSLRSFFVSPGKRKSKIEFDARHLIVSLS